MEQNTAHAVQIENRNLLKSLGVADVTSFTETDAKLKLTGGAKLIISGEKLQMIGFDKKSGELTMTGKINSLRYTDAGMSSPKRFFK